MFPVKRWIVLGLLLLLLSVVVQAQENPVVRDTGQLQVNRYLPDTVALNRYRLDPAFDYDEQLPVRNLWKELTQWAGEKLRRLFPHIRDAQVEVWLRIIFILAAVGLLGIITWMVLTGSFTGVFRKELPVQNVLIPGEEDIRELDIDELVARYVAEGNFRFAVRYMFLKMLKTLDHAGQIRWKPDKTNREFGGELTDPGLRVRFFRLAYLYDAVWYGNFPVDRDAFEKLKIQYDTFFQHEGSAEK